MEIAATAVADIQASTRGPGEDPGATHGVM